MSVYSKQIGFGGGCHWCTEAVFSSLAGIHSVEQGFIKSQPPDDQYSEAILVHHEEKQIPLDKLIEIHLCTHASTSLHSMRTKYRSAIYVNNIAMAKRCHSILNSLQAQFEKPLVTRVLETVHFKSSAESYIDYYATNPNKPFCITYIEPKLAILRRDFKLFLKTGPSQATENAR